MPYGLAALELLRTVDLGTRVVVRREEADGFHDALGYLRAIDADSCTIETRRGDMTVPLRLVTRAKTVPPPPKRAPRHGSKKVASAALPDDHHRR